MTITGMLGQSGLLTLLGMCVVFSFIIILIICMTIMKADCAWYVCCIQFHHYFDYLHDNYESCNSCI